VHLVGFIIRIYHDARSSECQCQRVCGVGGGGAEFSKYGPFWAVGNEKL